MQTRIVENIRLVEICRIKELCSTFIAQYNYYRVKIYSEVIKMIKRDEAFKAVVKFSTPFVENGENKVRVGTGFFLLKDENHLFLITANHVTKKFNENTIVSIAGKLSNVLNIPLNQLKTSNPIINHPSADVSAIEIDIATFNGLEANVVIYPMSIIVPEIISAISRDEELTSIGFPNGLGVGTSFEPFSFRSYPASNIVRNVSGLDGGYVSDAFFLENASCGGYSGCPIIDLGYRVTGMMTQTSNTYIYGIMHGTVSDNTGGKMAVVTPGYYILEII